MKKGLFLSLVLMMVLGYRLEAAVTVTPEALRIWKDTPDYYSAFRQVTINSGTTRFVVKEGFTWEKGKSKDTSLGLVAPAPAGWYDNAFIALFIGNNPLMRPYVEGRILQDGDKGLIKYIFKDTWGILRLSLMVVPDADYLMCEVLFDPSNENDALLIKLNNYPSTYSAFEGKRARYVKMADGGWGFNEKPPALDPEKHNWFFFQDNIFDVPTTPMPEYTSGPSALVVRKGAVLSIVPNINSDNYGVHTKITFKPGSVRFRFALFEFNKTANKEAFSYFVKKVPDVEKTLDTASFVPAFLGNVKNERERETLDQLSKAVRDAKGREEMGLLTKGRTAVSGYYDKLIQAEKEKASKGIPVLEQEANDEYENYSIRKNMLARAYSKQIDILYFKGMFNEFSRIREGLSKIPGKDVKFKDSYYSYLYWKELNYKTGDAVSYFPATFTELTSFAMVVFDNIPVRLFSDSQKSLIERYIKDGGCLIISGGPDSFAPSHYNNTPLAAMLPVSINRSFNLTKLDAWESVAKGSSFPREFKGLNLPKTPCVLWMHDLGVKEGGSCLMTVKGKPAVIAGSYGKGSVLCILATGLGKGPDKTLWEWDEWPRFIGLAGEYLLKGSRFRAHSIPASSSWLDLIKRWFREITDKRIRRDK